jgi:hypothetical protein
VNEATPTKPHSEDSKLITCYLPKGKAVKIIGLLHEEKGINTGNVISGRGQGLVRSISYGKWAEIEVLTVTVPAEKAEDIFWFMFDRADLLEPGGGFIFQAPLLRSTPFELPEIQEEP